METQTPDTQSLLERVEKLEKDARSGAARLRNYRFTTVVILLLIFSFVLLPRLSERWRPKTISARCFLLRDGEGKARASLMVTDQSGPCLVLMDREKNTRVFLGMFKSGEPQLMLCDDEGKARVVSDVSEKGDGRLSIYNAKGELVDTVPESGEFILGVGDVAGDDEVPNEE